jgi:hypothetical protein
MGTKSNWESFSDNAEECLQPYTLYLNMMQYKQAVMQFTDVFTVFTISVVASTFVPFALNYI